MKVLVFDNIEVLNNYIAENKRHRKNTDIKFKSFVVGEKKTAEGKVWEIVDRFLIIED